MSKQQILYSRVEKYVRYRTAYRARKNIYRFKNRYYKVIDFNVGKRQILIRECKRVLWFYRELKVPAFWIDEKMLFKKYKKI